MFLEYSMSVQRSKLKEEIAFKMFLLILFLSSFTTLVSCFDLCENCVPFTQCEAARELIARGRSDTTRQSLLKMVCGFEPARGLPKVCCSDNNNEEKKNSVADHPNVSLLPTDCGDILPSRLLGGLYSMDNEFPWAVQIAHRDRKTRTLAFKCVGTLINSRYVLTSADCIKDRNVAGVRVGKSNRLPGCIEDCELNYQDVRVSETIYHEDFSNTSLTLNNIGLLRLEDPVDLSKNNVGAICLPVMDEHRERSISDYIGTVTSWSSDWEFQVKLTMPIYSVDRCNMNIQRYHNYVRSRQFENGICAHKGYRCESFSGPPLMLEVLNHDIYKYFQYGILISQEARCQSSAPEIFTDVRMHIKWILDNIKV